MRILFLVIVNFVYFLSSISSYADNFAVNNENQNVKSSLANSSGSKALLTLETAIQETEKDSLKIQKSKSQYEEASWKKVETYVQHLPTLQLNGAYLPQHKYLLTDMLLGNAKTSVPAVIPSSQFTLVAQMPLFNGLRGTYTTLAAKNMESAAEKDYQWSQFQVSREVINQYYRALGAKLLNEVASVNLHTLQDHLSEVEKFKKAGMSTNYDVLRVEVQVSEAQSEVLNAHDNAEMARNKLAEIMGHDTETRELAGSLPVLSPDLILSLSTVEKEISARSDLEALADRSNAMSEYRQSSANHWVPQFNWYGQYQYYNNKNDEISSWGDYRQAYALGITMTWNLFDGMSAISKSQEALEQKIQAEITLRTAQLKAKQDFEFWRRKYLYYCSVFKSREGDVMKANESVRLAHEGRRVGSRTNTELLDAESELYRAQAGLVNAQVGSVEALINLELIVGKKLYDFTGTSVK